MGGIKKMLIRTCLKITSYRRKPVSSDLKIAKSHFINLCFYVIKKQSHWIPGQARNDRKTQHINFEIVSRNDNGTTLTELLITIAIFSVVMTGIYSLYTAYVRHATREYRLAQSEIETVIAGNIIERDIMMAGYGLAEDYGGLVFTPPPLSLGATDNIAPGSTINPLGGKYPTTGLAGADALYMMGTSLGVYSRASQSWTYLKSISPAEFQNWGDHREDVQLNDRVIYMEPNTRTILTEGASWRFIYPSTPNLSGNEGRGSIIYGLSRPPQGSGSEIPRPYYVVQYRLGGAGADMPKTCARGTRSLQRVEMTNGESIEPLLACVRDLQVAFGIDVSSLKDGIIDLWDNGGIIAASYDYREIQQRLKQVRVYILVQNGDRDTDYLYANPDNPATPERIRVGDKNLGIGRDIALTAEQRKYRWRLISLTITPRNHR
jgi:prepilin-type N-terminal cleavage/methylation domain-containing protein